jgi:dihydrofolate reductase
MINLIAAMDKRFGLADEHGIPWQGKLPTDSRYFREQTRQGVILMGFRTYEEFALPLHDRVNYVAAREGTPLRDGFASAGAVGVFLRDHTDETVWVLGGAVVYAETLGRADQLYLTQLDEDFHCTKFFPRFADRFVLASASSPATENGISFRFQVWRRLTEEERHDASRRPWPATLSPPGT